MQRDPATGERTALDQSSCHAVLREGYLEFSSAPAAGPGHHLASYAGSTARLSILAFGVDDLERVHRDCRARGIAVTAPAWASRDVGYGTPGEARFHWFMVEPRDSPDALVAFVRGATPEVVYQSAAQVHPNGAFALVEVTVAALDAADASARFARLLGREPLARAGEALFELDAGRLRIASMDAFVARHGERPARPGLAAVTVEAAARTARPAIDEVSAARAGGAVLRLVSRAVLS
jgi:hypothetical protein